MQLQRHQVLRFWHETHLFLFRFFFLNYSFPTSYKRRRDLACFQLSEGKFSLFLLQLTKQQQFLLYLLQCFQ